MLYHCELGQVTLATAAVTRQQSESTGGLYSLQSQGVDFDKDWNLDY
jgi:hypothetical protein